jgi:hypothetical protein
VHIVAILQSISPTPHLLPTQLAPIAVVGLKRNQLFVFECLLSLFELTPFVFDLQFQCPFTFYEGEDFGSETFFVVARENGTFELTGRTGTEGGCGGEVGP